ncbi:hypothetical protein BDR26DRAFT_982152 [Obelidium mucronatum]|nr:hypothetical protein BDR26DRAFT_982152 [Obelidium mucronatum]
MSDISSAVERAKAVAAKLTAAAKASGQLQDAAASVSASSKRRFDDEPPTSGYSKRDLYSSEPTPKRARDDPYADAPASGFKPKHGLGSDDATQSFLAKLGLSGGLVSTKISKEISIPADMVGLIIGRGGETLKRIQAESGVAKIQFESQDAQVADPSVRRTTLIGTEAEVDRANQMIMELVSGGDRKTSGGFGGGGGGGSHYGPRGTQVTMEVPGERVGLVIGRGGETIKMLQAKTGARITVVQDGNPRQGFKTVTIQGTDEQIEESKKMITDIVEARVMVGSNMSMGNNMGGGHHHSGQEMVEVRVPNDRVGLVIGKGGEHVKNVQNQFGVRLQIEQIPDPSGERVIKVYGPNQASINAAIEIINEKAGRGPGMGMGGGMNQYGGGGYGNADPYAMMQQQYGQQAGGAATNAQDYSAYYAAYYASDPSYAAAYAAQAGGAEGYQAAATTTGTDPYAQAAGSSSGDATAADGSAAASGDDAANAAAWAQYYAYYAQYGGADPSAGGATAGGAPAGGNEEDAPPGA